MPRVFISHACEDNEVCRKLAGCLRRDGVDIWIYYAKIEVDGSLPEVFKRAIEWCDALVLVWSKSAANSYCVNLEWQRAMYLKKTIIPCLLDDTKQADMLCNSFYINFNNFDQGYHNLVYSLNLNKNEGQEDVAEQTEEITDPILIATRFRSEPENLSEDEVEIMINKYDFFDNKRNENGNGFNNQFEVQEINGDNVIFDHTSGLMWQQSGSSESMWYDEVKDWITELNSNGYAGYQDWRLPTLEEAMSLMERERKTNDLYIDPIFDKKQCSIWTADLSKKMSQAWVFFLNYGSCYINCFDFNNYVRAVRSV